MWSETMRGKILKTLNVDTVGEYVLLAMSIHLACKTNAHNEISVLSLCVFMYLCISLGLSYWKWDFYRIHVRFYSHHTFEMRSISQLDYMQQQLMENLLDCVFLFVVVQSSHAIFFFFFFVLFCFVYFHSMCLERNKFAISDSTGSELLHIDDVTSHLFAKQIIPHVHVVSSIELFKQMTLYLIPIHGNLLVWTRWMLLSLHTNI